MQSQSRVFRALAKLFFSTLFSVLFLCFSQVSAAQIETNGANNCTQVDTVDFGDGYTLEHSSYRFGGSKNVGRTQLLYNGSVRETQDQVFWSDGLYEDTFYGDTCDVYSRLTNVSRSGNSISLSYTSYDPVDNSSSVSSHSHSNIGGFRIGRKSVDTIDLALYAYTYANDSDAVKYTVDSNEDGIFDEIPLTFPAIYQDLIAPITDIELNGLETPTSTGSTYYESVNIDLSSQDNEGGIGVKEIYYSLDSETPIYIPYIDTLVINGVGEYTLSFYAVDNFGNKEEFQTKNFTLVERPESYAGNISGYVYDDSNENGIRDEGEKYMAGWKVCIDENENEDCEENSEPFILTNNDGYYEFASLQTGEYTILEIPHQNWRVTNPTTGRYTINLGNGQVLTGQNFGNFKFQGNNAKK